MPKRKRGGMEAISTLIARAYPGREPADLSAHRALAWWSKAVSPKILKNARPVQLRRKVLTVNTATSAWASSLQFESENILTAIRRHCPEADLKAIRFRVGSLPEMPVSPRPKKRPPLAPVPLTELPDGIARELARIPDERVRGAVARAAAAGVATRAKRPANK